MARQYPRTETVCGILAVVFLVVVGAMLTLYRTRHRDVTQQALTTDLAQWQSYEGSWSSESGVLTDRTGGRGDKLLTGDNTWNDFIYLADIRFDSARDLEFGDAGLIMRASNMTVGTDSLYGYYVGLRPGTQTLKLGRMQDDFNDLAVQKLDIPIAIHSWYHVRVLVRDCTFFIQVQEQAGRKIGELHAEDRDCVIRAGQIGLRSYGMITSWRALSIGSLP